MVLSFAKIPVGASAGTACGLFGPLAAVLSRSVRSVAVRLPVAACSRIEDSTWNIEMNGRKDVKYLFLSQVIYNRRSNDFVTVQRLE